MPVPQVPLATASNPLHLAQSRISTALLPDPVLGAAVQHRGHGEEEPEADHAQVDCVAGYVARCVWGLCREG